MNNLHRDILDEPTSDFRHRILTKTVATARRRRIRRTVGKVAGFSALVLLAGLLSYSRWRSTDDSRTAAIPANLPGEPVSGYKVIDSEPFTAIIRTTQLPEKYRVHSASNIRILDPVDQPDIVPISDDQLLRLFAGRPVALIPTAKGGELILMETQP